MTTATRMWQDLPAARGALTGIDPASSAVWTNRVRRDRERANRHQSHDLAAITAVVESRSRELGAKALVLTGSTARGRRTGVSDLDYHVIGAKPESADLNEEIDIYSDEPARFNAKLRSGDDFVHWSVWYGCVLFDSGVVQRAASYIASENAWPDATRKERQARETLEFAERLIATGDQDAALEQVRGALSLTARWLLLSNDVFPLARDELADQLLAVDNEELAMALRATIHERPELSALADAVRLARARLPAHRVGPI